MSTKNKQNDQKNAEGQCDQLLQHAHKAMRILLDAGYDARLAGGCVRDRLLGRRPKDYDIATNALPDVVCTLFKQKSMRIVPTGIDHGTVTLVLAGQPLEITTLRRDVATDGRRAVVAFSDSFEEDAGRRDFTINALFEDIDGKVHDFFEGQKDLEAGILRFVGDPAQRIQEDYLRILRLFRFWARYGFAPAEGILPILGTEKRGLALISQERKTSELMQTLGEKAVGPVLQAMQSQGIHEELGFEALNSKEIQTLLSLGPAWARLALLFKGDKDKEAFRKSLADLRLPKNQEDWSLLLFWPGTFPGRDILDQMEFVDGIEGGPLGGRTLDDSFFDMWEKIGTFSAIEITQLREASAHPRRLLKLPIDGKGLMQDLGLKPGPELGESLRLVRRAFRSGLWSTAAQGLQWAAGNLDKKES